MSPGSNPSISHSHSIMAKVAGTQELFFCFSYDVMKAVFSTLIDPVIL
jgi:hypothetical protein